MPENKKCSISVIDGSTMVVGCKKGKHPTEKPMALYRWLIERYCPPNGTILDPTFGSGNSCFVAQEMGRHAIGMEKDKDFYDKAMKKIAQPANIWAKFNNDSVIPGNHNLMLLAIANPAGSSILNPTALMKFLNNFEI